MPSGVGFYEHVLDERWMRPLALPWLNARVVRDVRPLWSVRLNRYDMRGIEALIASGESKRHP